jgi:DNA-binding CsgD family transcriptional regulator
MFVVTKLKGSTYTLPAKELDVSKAKAIHSKLAQDILRFIASTPSYPKEIARKLKVHEQKVYYHIRNLEKARIIDIFKTKIVQGTPAKIYGIVEPAFVLRFKDFQESPGMAHLESAPKTFLEPFIENGKMNCTIIVGSPDPHGPEKARSRDGYYGMDLALFLGTFLNSVTELNVKLDTEAHDEDLNNNLILIGGPVVNTVTKRFNSKLPVRFEKSDNWSVFSSLSGKTFYSDETGIIVKAKNPLNPKKFLLIVAGKRYAGTRAVMIAFLKYFRELSLGNKFNKEIFAKVVEGVDLDSDGIVDDVEILE